MIFYAGIISFLLGQKVDCRNNPLEAETRTIKYFLFFYYSIKITQKVIIHFSQKKLTKTLERRERRKKALE